MQEQGTFRESDLPTVERYVVALMMSRRLRASLAGRVRREAAGELEDGEEALFSRGSTGQLVPHPAVKMAREAERDAQKFADALLLGPAARARAKLERLDDLLGGQGDGDVDDEELEDLITD